MLNLFCCLIDAHLMSYTSVGTVFICGVGILSVFTQLVIHYVKWHLIAVKCHMHLKKNIQLLYPFTVSAIAVQEKYIQPTSIMTTKLFY